MAGWQLDRLTKVYPGGVRALDDFTLSVEGAELVVLVGPSGCGKTTLLRLVAGLEVSTNGRIVRDGHDLTAVEPAARQVAMVFQDHALYPARSVHDNLAYPLRLLGQSSSSITDAVQRTAERLGLLDVLRARPGELSGGQRQRVALGKALIRRPALFLFDEPLSSLDAGMRRQLRQLIRQVQREARTPALYVTHDQEEALALADRLVVLDGGRVRQIGPPREVHDEPADRFVAGFVGNGMNFVEGTVDGSRLRYPGGVIEPLTIPPAWDGRAITLGFRPEALRHGAEAGSATMRGRVKLVEYQGDRLRVMLDVAGIEVSVCVEGERRINEGEVLTVSLPPTRYRWFAPGPTGATIREPTEPR